MKRLIKTLIISIILSCFTVFVLAAENASQKPEKDYLPIEVGTVWVFKEKNETEEIKIAAQEKIWERLVYRVEWFSGDYNKQTEYWQKTDKGVILIGRRAMGFEKIFAKPFYFLKYPLSKGNKWKGIINLGSRKVELNYTVGDEEVIKTEIGDFRSVKIILDTGRSVFERWYSPGYGIIKYASYQKSPNGDLALQREMVVIKINKPKN